VFKESMVIGSCRQAKTLT